MLDIEQLVQNAQQYPKLDVYLYTVMKLAQLRLHESELIYRNNSLILEYGRGRYWLLKLTSQGLQLPHRIWCEDAVRALQALIHDVDIDENGITNFEHLWVTHDNHVLHSLSRHTSHHLLLDDTLLDIWQEIDRMLTRSEDGVPINTPSSTKPHAPNYGDAQGSGINVHSQGEFYPLYHMNWRNQNWLCYANHAVSYEQCKQELRSMKPHDRTIYVVRYGVEINPTKPEERGAKSSVWPLEVRDDGKHGMVFTWGNLWMPHNKDFHKFLETRTADQRRECMLLLGDVLS